MNKSNNIIIGALVGLVVVAAGYFLTTIKPADTEKPVAAVASPDIQSPYFSFGGVREWAGRTDSLTAATTTVCAIQSPVSTSTLHFASLRLGVSTSTAYTITMAKATTPYATTTVLGNSVTYAAGSQVTHVATSTTLNQTSTDFIFAPSTYLVVGMAGNIGNFSPTGTCEAEWREN